MSERYQLVRLGDLCNSISGLWTGKKPPFEKATVIRNTNFTKDCKLDLSNVAVLDVETKQLQTRKLIPGDLIVEKSGGGPKQAVGRVVYFGETIGTYSLSNFTSALRLKDSSTAFPMYLQYFLYHQYLSGVTESMQSHSTGIRNLNIHQFLDINVPLPSLEKQRAVVAKLDSAFTEVDLLEENLSLSVEKVNQLLQSILNSEYSLDGIHLEPLERLVDILDNQRIPINATERLARVGDIQYYGATGQVGTIDKALFNETLILLGEDGVPFFNPTKHKAYEISGPSWVNNHAHVLRAKSEIVIQRYLLHFLNVFNYTGYVNGATRLKLTQADMKRIPVPLPPLEKQAAIVEKIDETFGEIELLKEQIEMEKDHATALRQSLLSSAFSQEEVVA